MISRVSLSNYQYPSYSIQAKPKPVNSLASVSFLGRNVIKNNIIMKPDGLSHFTFFDGEQKIGYAIFGKSDKDSAKIVSVPDDWFVKGGKPDERGNYPLKPNVYISEFVMDDKVGSTGEYKPRLSKKKYGVMCMQKILDWAEEHGFAHRISLTPGKTHSDVNPAIFYAKIGFDVSPEIAGLLKAMERFPQIDGRYISKGQEVFLVEPDVLKNYPLD